MKRVFMVLMAGVLLIAALTACGGGGDDESEDGGDSGAATPVFEGTPSILTSDPRESRRMHLPPDGDPYEFEPPFSVGDFVRETIRGRPTATRTGGQRVTYADGDRVVTLTAYYLDTAEESVETLRFAFGAPTIVKMVVDPRFTRRHSYGVVADRYGGVLAGWNHFQWVFLVRSASGQDALDEFLERFPY